MLPLFVFRSSATHGVADSAYSSESGPMEKVDVWYDFMGSGSVSEESAMPGGASKEFEMLKTIEP